MVKDVTFISSYMCNISTGYVLVNTYVVIRGDVGRDTDV